MFFFFKNLRRSLRYYHNLAVAVGILAALIIIYSWTPLSSQWGGLGNDGRLYFLRMQWFQTQLGIQVEEISAFDSSSLNINSPPWCWRVLTPAVVSIMPSDPISDLLLLNALTLFLTLIGLYALLGKLQFSSHERLIGLLFYLGSFWATRAAFHLPGLIEPLTQLLTVCILLAVVYEKNRLILLLFFLGALQKESIIALAPIAFTFRVQKEGVTRENQLHLAAMLCAALLPLGLLREAIPPSRQYLPSVALRTMILHQALSPSVWPNIMVSFFSGLGVLPIICTTHATRTFRILKRHPYLAVYLIIGGILLFGGSDKSRLLNFVLIPTIIVALKLIRQLFPSRTWHLQCWIVLSLFIHYFFGTYFSDLIDDPLFETWIAPIHATRPLTIDILSILLSWGIWLIATAILRWPSFLRSQNIYAKDDHDLS